MGEAERTLAARAAGQVSLDDAQGVARLLTELRAAGASQPADSLLARDPAGQVTVGREPDGAPSRAWTWHEPASEPASRPHRAEQQVIDDAAPPEQIDLAEQ